MTLQANQTVIKFTPKQAEAKNAAYANTITLYGGAIRGGKTYWLILMIWILAKRYPKSRWLILRNSYSTLQQTTLVTFQNLLNQGLSGDVVEWKQQTFTATLYNGSQVFFMAESYEGDKDLNRFRGLEINGAGIDECNEVQEATFVKIIERAGSWQHSPGCPIKILLSCNPANNWVKEKFYDRWERDELPKGWAYVPAKILDNPHLSPEYLQSLKLLPDHDYQKFVDGDWNVSLEGKLFPQGELNFYNPETVNVEALVEFKMGVIDPADTGGDDLSFPTGYLIGNNIYITDVIYNNDGTDVNEPACVEKICTTKHHYVSIEGNSAWILFAKAVRNKVQDRYEECEIRVVKNTVNKHTRILAQSGFIKPHFVFRSDYRDHPQYYKFMKNLLDYNKLQEGASKNKHEDSADSLAEMAKYFRDNFTHLW